MMTQFSFWGELSLSLQPKKRECAVTFVYVVGLKPSINKIIEFFGEHT